MSSMSFDPVTGKMRLDPDPRGGDRRPRWSDIDARIASGEQLPPQDQWVGGSVMDGLLGGMPPRVPGRYSVDPREGATRFDPQTAFQPLETGIGGLQNPNLQPSTGGGFFGRRNSEMADDGTQLNNQPFGGLTIDTPVPSQAQSIIEYLGTDAGDSGVYDQQFDTNNDGVVDMLDAQQSMQMNTGLRNPDGTAIPQAPAPSITGNPVAMSSFDPESIISLPTPPAATTQPINLPTPVEQPLAPYTGAGYDAFGEQPYIGSVVRNETGLDALSKQLLFGLDGQGGFIPGAMQAAETTFFNPDGTPRVVEEQRAGFTGDQTAGMDLARSNVGIQDRFLSGAEGAFQQGVSDIGQGIERGRGFQQRGLQELQSGIGNLQGELGGVEGIARGAAGKFGTQLGGIAGRGIGATDRFGRRIGGVEGMARGAADAFGTQLGGIAGRGIGSTDRFGRRIGESEGLLRGTTGAYDQGLTSQFYNPYEDQVVQQTIDDVFEAGEKQDMAARARDIQTGGESAFGSRARLSAGERREALGRGLGEALGGIRSRGFSEAQQTGLGEFARQRQAERLASSGLAGLSGQRLGAQQALGSQLTGLAGAQLGAQQNLSNQLSGLASSELGAQQALGSQLTGLAGAQLGAQQNLGSTLAGLAGTRFGAAQTGAGALSNMGALESQYGQSLANAQFGLGSNLQNLGAARQQAGAFDVNQLLSSGAVQQAQDQAVLDAQRRNQLQAQQAPLAQYQALAPFVSMAPAGQFTTQTQFSPRPSALQAGLSTGLGAFGAIGNFMNQGKG